MHSVLTSESNPIILAQESNSQEEFAGSEAAMIETENHNPETITPENLAKKLNVGRQAVYEGLRNGTIPSIRLGKRFVIPKSAIEAWLKTAGQAS